MLIGDPQDLVSEGRYTGQFKSPVCFAANKITLLKEWLSDTELDLSNIRIRKRSLTLVHKFI